LGWVGLGLVGLSGLVRLSWVGSSPVGSLGHQVRSLGQGGSLGPVRLSWVQSGWVDNKDSNSKSGKGKGGSGKGGVICNKVT
jgi:hypothetical protein